MKTSAYVTFDEIRQDSGAGKVCYCEVSALQKVSDLRSVISRSKELKGFPLYNLDLNKWYQFNPYLYDYFAAQIIPQNLDFLHLSCSPALAILERCKPKKYVVNVVAHDLQVSIDEHERYYGKGTYPFVHNIDQYLHGLLLKHAENADCILTPSSASAKWIGANISNAKRVQVISHGTDIPEKFSSIDVNKFVVGYLGAFGPDKGLPYLLLAWKYFNALNTELVFAGNCSKAFQDINTRNAFAQGVNRFRTLGWMDNIGDFYNNISVYCQPSVTEGFGIEILEAMAYGRPVIASSGAGGVDAITDGEDGFIVPPRYPKAIHDKIKFLYDHPDKMVAMGKAARAKSEKYSWKIIGEKCEKLYEELLCK